MNAEKLTAEEQTFVDKIHAEMKYYDLMKSLMGEVKGIFIKQGPEAAKQFIKSKADDILQIACDEMFWSLFNKL